MKTRPVRTAVGFILALAMLPAVGCAAEAPAPAPVPEAAPTTARILFLHHSTGECVWNGGVADWFDAYNAAHKTNYTITEQAFPKDSPYGWENYPYDYWNIWVRHAGPKPFQGEPTLEILAPKYDLIVWKHCFPVSAVEADTGQPDVASSEKRVENYKLQYAALKAKMRAFPKVRFIVWTGAALLKSETDAESARRAKAFFDWVRNEWDSQGDNIFVWDFRGLETEGGLYLKAAYAAGDSHPNETFSRKVAPLFCRRIVDVVQGRGDTANITGEGGAAVPPPLPPTEAPAEPAPVEAVPAAEEPKWTDEVVISFDNVAPDSDSTLQADAVKVFKNGSWVFDTKVAPMDVESILRLTCGAEELILSEPTAHVENEKSLLFVYATAKVVPVDEGKTKTGEKKEAIKPEAKKLLAATKRKDARLCIRVTIGQGNQWVVQKRESAVKDDKKENSGKD